MKKLLPLTLSVLTLFSACSVFQKRTVNAEELSKDYSRKATDATVDLTDFESQFMDFSLNFFQKTVEKNGKNQLFSPLSAALCLALINNGASGNTRAQLETLFGMDTETLNRSLYAYTSSLYSGENCKLSLANSIWMKNDALNVNPEFLQANADWYNAQAYAAPFDQSTIKDINNWCYNQTSGKIDKILNEIPSQAVMYLINAVDFDAKWLDKYEREDIEDGTFHSYSAETQDVTMLYSEESRYFIDENSVGFTKAYEGGKYHFMALLPDEGVDIYEYINSLNGEKWAGLWESGNPQNESYVYREVHARIPEFKYEIELSLKETLQALGVTDMFLPRIADFSGIDEGQPLYCDVVKQKAMIELDRNGTKAAAITMGGIGCMGIAPAPVEPLYITLDRPFVYALIDNDHNLPIFIGAVTDIH